MRRTPLTPASSGERLLAYLIDAIISVIPNLVIFKITGSEGLTMMIGFCITGWYYTHFTASPWQATPGKRLIGIYVIHANGQKLARRDALERFLAFILPSLPLYVSVFPPSMMMSVSFMLLIFWFSSILFTQERIGYHDRLCNTRVVVGKADQ